MHQYTEDDILNMLNFLIDNIFVKFGGQVFQQSVSIPMDTNCAPLLTDLLLYSYEAEFVQNLIKNGQKKLAQFFNFIFHYIDDVLSLSNPKFGDYVHLIYPSELEIKDTTESLHFPLYLDLYLEIDKNRNLCARLYDKRDDLTFL